MKSTATNTPIRQWMAKAFQVQPNSGLSPEFIAAALRIAISLTKQVANHNVEASEDGALPPPFPVSCIDWTDSVEVVLSASGDDVLLDLPGCETEYGADDHLNVADAKFVHNDHNSYQTNIPNEESQRIYSLGLVFYQLFSLGQVSLTPELLVVSSPNGELDNFSRALNVSDNRADQNNIKSPTRESEYSALKRHSSVSSRSRISCPGIVRCDESINVLRIQGVPSSICDLIRNMIDCINGSLMGNESYSKISDVTLDLQLMLQNPTIYLDPLDKEIIIQVGLELDENMPFGRDEELAMLQSAYQKSIAGSSELAVITGLSGSGKTMIANRFRDFVTASGGLFVSGKFDQMGSNSSLVIASAFNTYCEALAREENSVQAALIAFNLGATLGKDVHYLARMIPNLCHVLNDDFDGSFSYQECKDVQARIHHLLSRFVDVICDCSEKPLVLFIDDLQWAHSSSISIINHLLKSRRDGKLFFLGSYRDDELGIDHPLWSIMTGAKSYGFTTTSVKVVYLTKKAVNQFISDLLQLLPRLVASLSEIVFHKTRGDPLFISRMLLSLNRKGLLFFSLTRDRWDWDEGKILSEKIPDNVAMFFVATIDTLSADVKLALSTLSCFGNSVSCEIVHAIEADLGLNLIKPLDDAIHVGLLDKMNGKYCFGHDRIQEAACSIIDEQDIRLHHLNYGMSLIKSGNTAFLFTAVTQLNYGGPEAVQEQEHYSMIARYNLVAGKSAVEKSEFASAFNYFVCNILTTPKYQDNGITFLRNNHWQTEYELSLELYNHAAKCALVIKDLSSLKILCLEVAKYARHPHDMLDTTFITMSQLAYTNVMQSIEHGLHMLQNLGIDIPESSSREETLQQIAHIGTKLETISDEMLLDCHILTDYKINMATKILAKMCTSIHQCNPSLFPLVVIALVRLTIDHGVSHMSAIGFAYYGGMIAYLGDLRGGHRFTNLAKALIYKHRFICNEIAGEVIWVTSDNLSYVEPMQVIKEHRRESEQMSLVGGDIQSACINTAVMAFDQLWSGDPLTKVKEAVSSAEEFVGGYDHQITLSYLKSLKGTVTRLMIDENEDNSSSSNIYHKQLRICFFQRAFVSLIFDNFEEMKCNAEKYFEITVSDNWYLQAGYALQTFLLGLVSFRIYRETREDLWAQRAKKSRKSIESWNEQGSKWNFKHKLELMEAEEAYSNGDFASAQVLYDEAVSTAKQHKFIQEEALANELAAKFHFAMGNKSMSLKYFIEAHEKYYTWNAYAKVKALYSSIQEKFGGTIISESTKSDK